jgi:hypothetical protein
MPTSLSSWTTGKRLMRCCANRRQAWAIDAFGATVTGVRDMIWSTFRAPSCAGSLLGPSAPATICSHGELLALVPSSRNRSVSLMISDDAGGRVDHRQSADVIVQHQLGRRKNRRVGRNRHHPARHMVFNPQGLQSSRPLSDVSPFYQRLLTHVHAATCLINIKATLLPSHISQVELLKIAEAYMSDTQTHIEKAFRFHSTAASSPRWARSASKRL